MSTKLTGKIVFASGKTGDYDIWSLDLEAGDMQQLTYGTNWNDKPAWSPCGQWVAFVSNASGFQELFKVSVDTGEIVQLTELRKWCDSPRFSPDGTQIAFVSNEAGENDIWTMNADGSNRRQITRHNGFDSHVEWTSDSAGLLWSSDQEGGDANVWFIDLMTMETRQLTHEFGADIDPVQSPDGTLIAFVSNRQLEPNGKRPFADRDKDLWMMRSDGSSPIRLTDNQGCDFCTCWSPDGRSILYASNTDHSCTRLRILDVSELVDAFRQEDEQSIQQAADRLRSKPLDMDRTALKAEVGAVRHTNLLTSFLPEKWVQSCYPAGYFGQERYPHWIDPAVSAQNQELLSTSQQSNS